MDRYGYIDRHIDRERDRQAERWIYQLISWLIDELTGDGQVERDKEIQIDKEKTG